MNMEIKQLKPEEYSEARKAALREIYIEKKKRELRGLGFYG